MSEPNVVYGPGGRYDVFKGDDGVWRVTWFPADQAEGSHTYSPGDPDLPPDFPTENTREALHSWARERFGH